MGLWCKYPCPGYKNRQGLSRNHCTSCIPSLPPSLPSRLPCPRLFPVRLRPRPPTSDMCSCRSRRKKIASASFRVRATPCPRVYLDSYCSDSDRPRSHALVAWPLCVLLLGLCVSGAHTRLLLGLCVSCCLASVCPDRESRTTTAHVHLFTCSELEADDAAGQLPQRLRDFENLAFRLARDEGQWLVPLPRDCRPISDLRVKS